jgi:hypothetical protein
MSDLDEESRAIGDLEGGFRLIHEEQVRQGKKLDSIENKLTGIRIKTATLATMVSLAVTVFFLALRTYIYK